MVDSKKLTDAQRKKGGYNRKGTKNKKTIVKEILGIHNLEDLRPTVIKNWRALLNDKNKKYRFLATKEISKYLFPKVREHKIDAPGVINFIVSPSIAGKTTNPQQIDGKTVG